MIQNGLFAHFLTINHTLSKLNQTGAEESHCHSLWGKTWTSPGLLCRLTQNNVVFIPPEEIHVNVHNEELISHIDYRVALFLVPFQRKTHSARPAHWLQTLTSSVISYLWNQFELSCDLIFVATGKDITSAGQKENIFCPLSGHDRKLQEKTVFILYLWPQCHLKTGVWHSGFSQLQVSISKRVSFPENVSRRNCK